MQLYYLLLCNKRSPNPQLRRVIKFLWVRNLETDWLDSSASGSLVRLHLRYRLGLQLSEGLTGAGGPAPGLLGWLTSRCWVLAGSLSSSPGGSVTELLKDPHDMEAGFLQMSDTREAIKCLLTEAWNSRVLFLLNSAGTQSSFNLMWEIVCLVWLLDWFVHEGIGVHFDGCW